MNEIFIVWLIPCNCPDEKSILFACSNLGAANEGIAKEMQNYDESRYMTEIERVSFIN